MERSFDNLPDGFRREPSAPAMVAVAPEQWALAETIQPEIFPKEFHRRRMQIHGYFIVPAFAANQSDFIPERNIFDIQSDNFDLPEALKQKESDYRSQS